MRQEGKAGVEAVMRGHSRGCAACHNGVGIGGQMFQKFGLVEEYWKTAGSQEIDKGRFGVTQDPANLYVFKVPSLRNVVMTPSGDVVDVELMVSHASSTWMAMAIECDEHDGGSPHRPHDPMAVAVSGTTTV